MINTITLIYTVLKNIRINSDWPKLICLILFNVYLLVKFSGGSRGAPLLLFWVKIEEMTKGKKASRRSKSSRPPPPPPPPLSSRAGSATEIYELEGGISTSPQLQVRSQLLSPFPFYFPFTGMEKMAIHSTSR